MRTASRFHVLHPNEISSMCYFWRTCTDWKKFQELGHIMSARSARFRALWEQTLEDIQYVVTVGPLDSEEETGKTIMHEMRMRINLSEVARILSLGGFEDV